MLLNIVNKYQLNARIAPGVITLLPYGVAVWTWLPPTTDFFVFAGRFGIFAFCVYAFSHIARRLGKNEEEKLRAKWGGHPTVKFLRWSDETINSTLKKNIHLQLSGHTGINAPTREEEQHNPAAADHTYKGYSEFIRAFALSNHSNPKFTIVTQENTDYGFHRNLYGLRYMLWSGITIAIISLFFAYQNEHSIAVSLIITTGIFLYTLTVRKKNILRASNEYAKRLLESALFLPVQKDAPPSARDPDLDPDA